MKIGYDAKRIFHNTTGLGNYSRDLVRILSEFYPKNQYFLYNPKSKKVNRLKLIFNMKEVLPKSKFWQVFSSLWRRIAVPKQVKKDGIEIFHGLSGELPRGLHPSVKKVVTIHDLIFIRYPHLYSYADRKIHFKKFKYACKKADLVIAISEQTKKDIVDFLGINPDKIKVVYQGCHAVFKQEMLDEDKQQVLEDYQLPEKFILNVGTIQERKNALTIVKSIKDIDTSLVIVGGKTKYYNQLEKFIEKHNLQQKVFFVEGVSLKELACLYQQAILSVYPSIFEGFGIPIIESMFCKTPVITTKGGVFPEAGGNHSIYLENPLDENEMKNAIQELLLSEEKRVLISNKSYEFVQKFTDDTIAKNIMNIYTDLVAR